MGELDQPPPSSPAAPPNCFACLALEFLDPSWSLLLSLKSFPASSERLSPQLTGALSCQHLQFGSGHSNHGSLAPALPQCVPFLALGSEYSCFAKRSCPGIPPEA